MNVSQYLVDRLTKIGVKHIFGVPGDYVLDFYSQICSNKDLEVINTANEAGAGFAADAYARIHGVGCVCVTYNVGTLNVANAIACAYAERSPVVLISGSPGMGERQEGMLLHHMVRSFESQKDIFENITCASVVLDDPQTAGYKIDYALECLNHKKQPIYIELPRDIAKKTLNFSAFTSETFHGFKSDKENLEEAVFETKNWIEHAKNPVILLGVQAARYGLSEGVCRLAERLNIPIATTLLAKSAINENFRNFIGVYMGDASHVSVKEIVDNSDCLLMFGVLKTDMTVCFKPDVFPKRQVVNITVEGLKIRNHSYVDVNFSDFCNAVFNLKFDKKFDFCGNLVTLIEDWSCPLDRKITTKRFFEKIQQLLKIKGSNWSVVADIGDSLFGSSDLKSHNSCYFLSPAFYTTMGFSIPGSLGAMTASRNRSIVLVGDGAFQMCFNELATISKRKLNPIIFVLNNKGFTTERFLKDGSFNDVANMQYHKVPEIFSYGAGYLVETEQQLEDACSRALASKEMSIIEVCVEKKDISLALGRLTEALAKRV